MKKLVFLVLNLVLAIAFLLQSAYAYDWQPPKNLTEADEALLFQAGAREFPTAIKEFARVGNILVLRLKNGSTVFAGTNGGQAMDRNYETAKTSEPSHAVDSDENQSSLNNFVKEESEELSALSLNLTDLLAEMKSNGNYNYTETDKIFSTIFMKAETRDWGADPLEEDSRGDKYGIFNFALSSGYGRRYGLPATELLSRLAKQYPDNTYLQNTLKSALSSAIIARYAQPEETPTPAERRWLSNMLFDSFENYYQARPDAYFDMNTLDRGVLAIMGLTAPDVLQKFADLEKTHATRNSQN